jgi:hypothetical protein
MRLLFRVIGVFSIVFVSGHLVVAQPIAVGVAGGVRTTDDVSGSLTSESKRYIVGPTVDIRLPKRFSVEVDALYQRFGFTGYENSCCGYAIVRERANSWEFPMILKYRLPVPLVHPFVGVGYAPRIVNGTDVSSGSYMSGLSYNPPMDIYTNFYNQRTSTSYSVTQGVVVSGGVSFGAGHLRFTPEVRYVHWNAPFLNEQGGDGSFLFVSKQNEVFVLLGISWR